MRDTYWVRSHDKNATSIKNYQLKVVSLKVPDSWWYYNLDSTSQV